MRWPKRRPRSIRTRIAAGFVALLSVAFFSMALSYNLVVNKYVESQAHLQLGIARDNVSRDALTPRFQGDQHNPRDFENMMPRVANIARRASFLTQVQVLVIGEQNQLIYPAEPDSAPGDATNSRTMPNPDAGSAATADLAADLELTEDRDYLEKSAVFASIQHNMVDLSDGRIQRIWDRGRVYYLSSMRMDAEDGNDATHLVLYMDMTDVAELAKVLNGVLLVIIAIAAVVGACVTVLMSMRISKPIRALSDFAEAIGENDFTPREIACVDRELIELTDAMNRAAAHLDKYDKDQKTFFQNVSHELRTPLMSIRGYAEGIHVGVFDDDRTASSIIIDEADELTKMVEELLYLSKMDNVTDQSERSVLDVREVLSGCGEALRGVAIQEGKAISYDFADEPVIVRGAERPLERAFSNLIINALRYAKSSIVLCCHADGNAAVVCVEDDGDGIDANELPRVFDRFFKGRSGKHGIGLSIVKAVVTSHAGEVEAQNSGHGAIFVVRLPLSDGE